MTDSPWLLVAAGALVAVAALGMTRTLFHADAARAHLLVGARLSAGAGPLHRASPRLKLLGLVTLAVAAALLPPTRLVVPGALLLGLVVLGRVPLRFLLGRLAELGPFVVLAAVGALLQGDPARFGAVLGRALVTVLGLVLLIATTPQPDLLRAARRLGMPTVLVTLLGLTLRYLLVLIDEGNRLSLGFAARAVGPRDLRLARPLGRVVGALAVRTIERGERVHQAMLARGFEGQWPSWATPDTIGLGQLVGFVIFCLPLAVAVGWPR